MTAQEIRKAYLDFFREREHAVIPRALLVPQNDPTTLFTGSGMQPLLPYLLGQEHPDGVRLADSQTSIRAQDIEEVGDNRHTTFFEMLGNWSLGDYTKEQQIPWMFEFLTDVVGIDPNADVALLKVDPSGLDLKPLFQKIAGADQPGAYLVGLRTLDGNKRRWVRVQGPAGRPLDALLNRDFAAFEDALAEQVRVCPEDGLRIVSEAPSDDVKRYWWAGRERERGARVAEDVQAANRNPRGLAVAHEPFREALRMDRSSELVRKYQVVVLVGRAGEVALK